MNSAKVRKRAAGVAARRGVADLRRELARWEQLAEVLLKQGDEILAFERQRHREALAEKDRIIATLRKEIADLRDRTDRRPNGAPRPWDVRAEWRKAVAEAGSHKAALAALKEKHGWNPRMVERVIASTDEMLAKGMGITVSRLRAMSGRPPPRS